MLRYKTDRRGVAEVNGYTAKRLNDMAVSLSTLARSCAEDAVFIKTVRRRKVIFFIICSVPLNRKEKWNWLICLRVFCVPAGRAKST